MGIIQSRNICLDRYLNYVRYANEAAQPQDEKTLGPCRAVLGQQGRNRARTPWRKCYPRDNSVISQLCESMTSMLNCTTSPLEKEIRGLFDPPVHMILVKTDKSQVGFYPGVFRCLRVRKDWKTK